MMSPATQQQYFWMIDGQSKEMDYRTSSAFDTVVKVLRFWAAVAITDQSDTPVSFYLFDVFQWHAGGGHCMCLEHFSRLQCANSQTHSLTAVINTTLRTGTVWCHAVITAGVNYTGRWSTIAAACQASNVTCRLWMHCQLSSVSVFVFSISILLSFWTYFVTILFPFLLTFLFPFSFSLTESV